MNRFAIVFVLVLGWAITARSVNGQPDFTRAMSIDFGVPVSESINSVNFFDWWRFAGRTGDIVYVRMTGVNGLAPLIGILDAGGDLIARSDDPTPAAPNSETTIRLTLPQDGDYIIVATRVGNENGTTTGDYVLQIDWLNPPPTRDPLYQDITFECDGETVTAALTLQIYPDEGRTLTARAYGIDGFRPIWRYIYDGTGESGCTSASAVGDVVTLIGDAPRAITPESADASAQLTIPESAAGEGVVLMLGARAGTFGRFVVLIDGFEIAVIPPNTPGGVPVPADSDDIGVRRAPRAGLSTEPLWVYMVAESAARLDPYMQLGRGASSCDDAGRRASGGRGCEGTPAFIGAGVSVAGVPTADGTGVTAGARYIGDRFDAGMGIAPGDTLPALFTFTTFNRSTGGAYGVVLIGDVPG
jgi:hypothetical protein